MREGAVFTSINTLPVRSPLESASSVSGYGGPSPEMSIYRTGIPSTQSTTDSKAKWREKTGQKRGLLRRSDEKTMEISGHRCIKCGYIELYVRE